MPDVFIVPADIVKNNLSHFPARPSKPTDFWFNIIENESDITDKLKGIWAEHGKWHEAWHLIKSVSATIAAHLSSRSSRPMTTCRWNHRRLA